MLRHRTTFCPSAPARQHILEADEWRRDAAAAPFVRGRDTFTGVAPLLDIGLPAGMFESAFALGAGVVPVGMHRFAGIGRMEQRLEYGDRPRRFGGDFADELIGLVHSDAQLAAEVQFTIPFGPARVDIFLRPFVGFPNQRYRAVSDGFGLVALIALYRRLHQRGINDLAAARNAALFLQILLGCSNSSAPAPAQTKRSGSSQIVLASRMLLLSVRSRNCRKLRQSSNGYSSASSASL
jgi:hypothetical protein